MAATIMTVKRPDGAIETVERPGTITDPKTRRQFETATREAGRGEIIDWQIVGPTRPIGTQRTANTGLYTRNQRVCRGCGRRGDDGECGLGDY